MGVLHPKTARGRSEAGQRHAAEEPGAAAGHPNPELLNVTKYCIEGADMLRRCRGQ